VDLNLHTAVGRPPAPRGDAQPLASRTLVVGLGKTGLSCARYLARQGLPVAVTDSRTSPPGLDRLREELPDTALFLGGFSADVFQAAGQLVVSPGVPMSEPLIQAARARGVPVFGDIELFARAVRAPVAAVTGSNGKSTVVSLLGEMTRQAGWSAGVGGNLGEPALELLRDDHRGYVLELSSFQLETTHSLQPAAAAVLNVSPDHMDRYPSLSAYAAAKARIYRGARVGVINRDDPLVAAMAGLAGSTTGFTLGPPGDTDFGLAERDTGTWLCRGGQTLLPAADLPIRGRHNLANALAALALGEALGLPMPAMLDTLRRFRGLAHRTQLVAEKAGVRFYNDSKGTNVGATVAALDGLHQPPGRAILIAGGDGKGAAFADLAPVVARTCRAVVLIGRDAPLLQAALQGHTQLLHAATLEEAVTRCAGLARPGDQVLLSPACASFDMFRNYEHRGEVFIAAVERLPA
jgi:UDP-N-acetylmuramoylalanine--D-glutamate ligase